MPTAVSTNQIAVQLVGDGLHAGEVGMEGRATPERLQTRHLGLGEAEAVIDAEFRGACTSSAPVRSAAVAAGGDGGQVGVRRHAVTCGAEVRR